MTSVYFMVSGRTRRTLFTGNAEALVSDIDMRKFAESAGVTLTFSTGDALFREGDAADCLFVVQSGSVEMVIQGRVIDTCRPGDALGFMSVIDGAPRTSTARAEQTTVVSAIDRRTFRFMIDEVPNFATYIMSAMAGRIRDMGHVIGH